MLKPLSKSFFVFFSDEAETKIAFERHFEEELSRYGPVYIINLVEQVGKERVIWDAFTNHVIAYDHPDLTYVTFDFHEYWWADSGVLEKWMNN